MSKLRIAMVAGESSGDLLGADLIHALRHIYPNIVFEGMAGPKMIEAGCKALFRSEEIAVMGFIDPLKKLPRILKIRSELKKYFLENKPDIFIGIDSPDFNLELECCLKQAGIKTVHYVSPSVWAWRKWRIYKIKKAVDLMLTLLPFEKSFYDKYHVHAKYVGHPLADQIPLVVNKKAAREKLGLSQEAKVIALLPGSRAMEIKYLASEFIRTANYCKHHMPDLQFVTAMINEERAEQFKQILKTMDVDLKIKIVLRQSWDVMAAADSILLASGTAALEAMLHKCPTVVAYRTSFVNYLLAKCLVGKNIKYFSLPNLIADKPVIKEFLQGQVNAKSLGDELLSLLKDEQKRQIMLETFQQMHQQLKHNASEKASKAIIELLSLRNPDIKV